MQSSESPGTSLGCNTGAGTVASGLGTKNNWRLDRFHPFSPDIIIHKFIINETNDSASVSDSQKYRMKQVTEI